MVLYTYLEYMYMQSMQYHAQTWAWILKKFILEESHILLHKHIFIALIFHLEPIVQCFLKSSFDHSKLFVAISTEFYIVFFLVLFVIKIWFIDCEMHNSLQFLKNKVLDSVMKRFTVKCNFFLWNNTLERCILTLKICVVCILNLRTYVCNFLTKL